LDAATVSSATGTKWFTLSFLVDDGAGNAAWGGVVPLNQNWYMTQLAALRAQGGDVIISFGGATGSEIAVTNTDVTVLQAKYQSVINQYKVKRLDFDIEGAVMHNTAANDRRSRALAALKAANPGLVISFTLPVMPFGLTYEGLNILRSARTYGLHIDIVNIMTMCYGSGVTDMGQAAIDAATNTYAQVRSLGFVNPRIGVTPMIGQNDVAAEVFYQNDARRLLAFATQNKWISWIGMWSVNRDVNNINGPIFASTKIPQQNNEFSSIFAAFK